MSQQQQFQPQVYPYNNNVPTQPNEDTLSSSHANGSFGTVFWVIGVIIVVSVLACIANRLCTKKSKDPNKPSKKNKDKKGHGHNNNNKLPKEWAGKQSRRPGPDFHHDNEGDIEFGFGGKRFPNSAKVAAANGGDHHPRSMPPPGMMPGFKHGGGGGGNKGVRFANDHIDFKPAP